ncbi:hypothetical protein Bca4012_008635 [Brassica carinata]
MLLTYKLPPCMIDLEDSQSKPTNVETSLDVEVMMSVDEWTKDVQLCVTQGALEVAKYQFLCRSPFTIGSRTFLSEGTSEEQHLEMINGVIRHDEMVCSEEVLKEVFSEDKMVLLHRFSLEVEKAKITKDLNANPPLFNTNINVAENNAGAEFNNGGHSGGINRANQVSEADEEMSDSQNYFATNWSEMGMGPGYWESMIDHGYMFTCIGAGITNAVGSRGDQVGIGQHAGSGSSEVGDHSGINPRPVAYEVISEESESGLMGQNGV